VRSKTFKRPEPKKRKKYLRDNSYILNKFDNNMSQNWEWNLGKDNKETGESITLVPNCTALRPKKKKDQERINMIYNY